MLKKCSIIHGNPPRKYVLEALLADCAGIRVGGTESDKSNNTHSVTDLMSSTALYNSLALSEKCHTLRMSLIGCSNAMDFTREEDEQVLDLFRLFLYLGRRTGFRVRLRKKPGVEDGV